MRRRSCCSRALIIFPTTARSRWKRPGRLWKKLPRTIRRCWSGRARCSPRCSTASLWISAALPNMDCLARSCCRISGPARAIRALFSRALFDMCRYWFILTSGKYCSMSAETNANINLQLAPMALGYHREGEEAYFNWMESLVPDFRTNAKNIFGMRGTQIFPHAEQRVGRRNHVRPRGFNRDWRNLAASPTGWPTDPGVCARSGTTIWSPATWISSANAWCRLTKIWRCFTRIS